MAALGALQASDSSIEGHPIQACQQDGTESGAAVLTTKAMDNEGSLAAEAESFS